MRTLSLLFAPVLLMACGGDDDPLSYSAPVGINLKIQSGDVKNGVVMDEKSITSESANPFGKFISDAQAQLGGMEPGRFELQRLTLALGAGSKGITGLEEAYQGEVQVQFLMDSTDNSFNAGKINDPSGSGPLEMTPQFDWSLLNEADRDKFFSGSFKVVIRGNAASGFDQGGGEADLNLTHYFAAFE